MSEENITIPKKVYDNLIGESLKLRALESAGVDNWDGYDFAMEILEEIQSEQS